MNKGQDVNLLRQATFFDKAEEVFVILDKDLRLVGVNKSFLKISHFKEKQVIGKLITDVIPGIENTERYKIYQRVLQTGVPHTIDNVIPHPNLGNYCTRIQVFKVADGLGVAAMDITDLKEAIDELNTFSYKASHDMRSPLATIMGLITVAEQESKDLETLLSYLSMIKQQAERMDHVLRELVALARIRKEKRTYYPIEFHELIDEVQNSVVSPKKAKNIRFEKHIDLWNPFYSDKSLLISILQNLIDNAVKYQKKQAGGWVSISVTDEGAGLKLVVADNGMGIKAQHHKNVFNMFFRATNRVSGTGLGLYNVKHCVKQLGGEIAMESSGEGTTFTIYLPHQKVK